MEQKSVTKNRSKFSCEIVLEFQKININYYQVEEDTSLNFRDKQIRIQCLVIPKQKPIAYHAIL